MSLEQNKAIVHRYAVEPWSTGNLAVLDELCSPDLAIKGTFPLADFRQLIVDTRRAIPDLTNTVEEMIAEGDKVVFRWTMRGTHRGDYQGIAPTGKPVTATGITVVRLANGKIVEDRFESGSPSFEQQVSEPASK
jgi:steroid delta-isomerase-like uncharacterized protein